MKKSLHYSLLFVCFLFTISSPLEALLFGLLDFSVEGRVAYYRPCSKRVRRIYSDDFTDYQLVISKGLLCNWRVWAGVSGLSTKGRSLDYHERTRLQLIPVSFGVQYLFSLLPCTYIYLGGAACYSFLHIEDHGSYLHKHVYKARWGGLAQSGVYFYFTPCVFANAFADYYFQRFDFSRSHSHEGASDHYVHHHDLNMSGYKLGVGVGLTF